jgi:hypothetical protein
MRVLLIVPSVIVALLAAHPAAMAKQNPRNKPVSRKVAPKPKLARCLPVVAPKCGCVYSCGVGWPVGKGRFRVRHSFWGKTPLSARVDRWCVGKRCTRAFFAEIVCSGICPRRPADPTCRFVKDLCVSGKRRSKKK